MTSSVLRDSLFAFAGLRRPSRPAAGVAPQSAAPRSSAPTAVSESVPEATAPEVTAPETAAGTCAAWQAIESAFDTRMAGPAPVPCPPAAPAPPPAFELPPLFESPPRATEGPPAVEPLRSDGLPLAPPEPPPGWFPSGAPSVTTVAPASVARPSAAKSSSPYPPSTAASSTSAPGSPRTTAATSPTFGAPLDTPRRSPLVVTSQSAASTPGVSLDGPLAFRTTARNAVPEPAATAPLAFTVAGGTLPRTPVFEPASEMPGVNVASPTRVPVEPPAVPSEPPVVPTHVTPEVHAPSSGAATLAPPTAAVASVTEADEPARPPCSPVVREIELILTAFGQTFEVVSARQGRDVLHVALTAQQEHLALFMQALADHRRDYGDQLERAVRRLSDELTSDSVTQIGELFHRSAGEITGALARTERLSGRLIEKQNLILEALGNLGSTTAQLVAVVTELRDIGNGIAGSLAASRAPTREPERRLQVVASRPDILEGVREDLDCDDDL